MASAKYNVWDAKYNQPIVGGKVTNPTTGKVEDAGPIFVAGPPSIDAIWINVASSSSSGWRSVGAPLHCAIDEALHQITLYIQQGFYSIISLNASAYSLTIVCKIAATSHDFRQVIRAMRSYLYRDLFRDEEPVYSQVNESALSTGPKIEGSVRGAPEDEDNFRFEAQ